MTSDARSLIIRYGFAVLAAAVALAVRLVLDPWLEGRVPFLLACLAVVAVAWHGGFGPALIALVIGLLTCPYFFLPPRYSLAASWAGHQPQLIGFAILGVTVGLFSERSRAARQRAEVQAREAVRHQRALEQEVQQRQQLEENLQQSNRALAEAARRKDEFLAMLGHELRNPLAPIGNAVALLRLAASQEPQVGEACTVIERQLANLTHLVDDLLDVARITRGKVHLRRRSLDLAAVLERAIELTGPLIEGHRHTLTRTRAGAPLWVQADATRVEQVFANLLNNAAKYTACGGVIQVIEECDGAAAVVRIRDSGFGIAPALLPHVFELFAQADRTLDRAQGGLGIGLTLVKTLVELHGGTVTASSGGIGQGSEFVVRLPLIQAPGAPPPATEALPPPAAAAALHVLVVEDNKDAADSLAMLLKLWGHRVRTSHDGLAGLTAARHTRPEVVLLDIGLPGMDGYEVARQLRQEFGPAIRLVAMTGYGQEEDRRRAWEAGFNAHLVKPADPATLQALLAQSDLIAGPAPR
jgi:signal transduction histidine kinase/ActR/RegA family two-component response regulator